MKKYRKTILTPGVYQITRPNGETTEENITLDRMQRWASTANQMAAAGIKIPAPFAHKDDKGRYPTPVRFENDTWIDARTNKPIGWRADLNGGFWQNFMVDRNGLHAAVEADGDVEDKSSPAGKISKTVKDTSIFVLPSFKDGTGREWGEAIYHIALVVDPVEPAQRNFEPIEADSPFALAMSLSMSQQTQQSGNSDQSNQSSGQNQNSSQRPGQPSSNGDQQKQDPENPSLVSGGLTIQDAIEALGALPSPIVLPEDTTPANLVERIVLVCRQKMADEHSSDSNNEESGGRMTTRPSGSETKSPAIAMSQTPSKTETPEVDPKVAILMSNIVGQKKKSIQARVDALVKNQQITQEYADQKLKPLYEAISMSIDDVSDNGELADTPVELILTGLESAFESRLGNGKDKDGSKAVFMSRLPEGASVLEKPEIASVGYGEEDDSELSEEYMNAVIQREKTGRSALI